MKRSWEVICLGLQAGIYSKDIVLPDDIDWNEVYEESKKQGITGLVYQGIKDFLPADLKVKWRQYNFQVQSHAVRIANEQAALLQKLQGLPACILKGSSAAVYYPEPLLRSMGDIDFIVAPSHFEEAKQRLIDAGYILDNAEAENPRHIKLYRHEIAFEMHHRFSYDEMDMEGYINRSYDRLEMGTINNTTFPMLPKLENGLILLAHLRQHLYSGLGLRQVLDWMMYVTKVLDDPFWTSAFQPEAKKLGMEKLAVTAAHLCQMYFGLDAELKWCAHADEQLCNRLLDSIIISGNFGHANGTGKRVEKTIINLRKEGLFKYLQAAGEYNWKALKKHHWLKPFAWLYQLGRYMKQGIRAGRHGGG